jgi:hypothetical protein
MKIKNKKGKRKMSRRERRRLIICPNCRVQMVCMNRFESIYKLIRGYYVWYICPRRKGESGCGHTVLFEISPRTKRLKQIGSSAKLKRRKTLTSKSIR